MRGRQFEEWGSQVLEKASSGVKKLLEKWKSTREMIIWESIAPLIEFKGVAETAPITLAVFDGPIH